MLIRGSRGARAADVADDLDELLEADVSVTWKQPRRYYRGLARARLAAEHGSRIFRRIPDRRAPNRDIAPYQLPRW